jgi:hypothetical protein
MTKPRLRLVAPATKIEQSVHGGQRMVPLRTREPTNNAFIERPAFRPGAELGSALDRLITAGLLFRQGVPPPASYLFKHALV